MCIIWNGNIVNCNLLTGSNASSHPEVWLSQWLKPRKLNLWYQARRLWLVRHSHNVSLIPVVPYICTQQTLLLELWLPHLLWLWWTDSEQYHKNIDYQMWSGERDVTPVFVSLMQKMSHRLVSISDSRLFTIYTNLLILRTSEQHQTEAYLLSLPSRIQPPSVL
jgi:hypothetical protein